jgi:hypothetical protein
MSRASLRFSVTRKEAEAFLEEIREDEPELAEMLGVEAIDVGERNPN